MIEQTTVNGTPFGVFGPRDGLVVVLVSAVRLTCLGCGARLTAGDEVESTNDGPFHHPRCPAHSWTPVVVEGGGTEPVQLAFDVDPVSLAAVDRPSDPPVRPSQASEPTIGHEGAERTPARVRSPHSGDGS